MLVNVIDSRTKKYATNKVNAVLEPAWRSNGKDGADQHDRHTDEPDTDTLYGLSVAKAFETANGFEGPVTVYLYDADRDPAAPKLSAPRLTEA